MFDPKLAIALDANLLYRREHAGGGMAEAMGLANFRFAEKNTSPTAPASSGGSWISSLGSIFGMGSPKPAAV
jgi:hypothetical protein